MATSAGDEDLSNSNIMEGEIEDGEALSGDEGSGEDISAKKIGFSDDSDEEDEEDEQMTEADKKFIADEDDDDSQDENAVERRRRKKERKRKIVEENFSDDELDLINENIGKSNKRLRKKADEGVDELDMIFDEEEQPKEADVLDSDDDDIDNFIVRDDDDAQEDDEDVRRDKQRRKKERMELARNLGADHGISDNAWRDIEDLFGTGDDYPHAMGLGPSSSITHLEEDFDGHDEGMKIKEISIRDVYEPSEIAERMLTDKDELIRITDIPERYQSTNAYLPDDQEIAREASFITKTFLRDRPESTENVLSSAITCVLRFIRRDQLEVPFIIRHRRDYFDGTLGLQDLWRIVDLDEKFIAVELKKKGLMKLILQISSVDVSIETDEQVVSLVEKIITPDDVTDTFAYIHLIYAAQISELQSTQNHRRVFKRAAWKILYDDSIANKISEFAKLYYVNIADFVMSVTTRQSLHFPEDHIEGPLVSAEKFVTPRFSTSVSVVGAARHMIAQQIAVHPQIRAFIRRVFYSDSVICVQPTEKGKNEIETQHPYSPFKYILDKPVHKFVDGQFAQLLKAETQGLLTISIRVDEEARLLLDLHKFICNDYVNELAGLWNSERKAIADLAAKEFLFPQTVKWLKEKLGSQASELIALRCQSSMEKKISMQPFRISPQDDSAPTVLSISWGDGAHNAPTYAVLVNENGEMIDSLRLDKLTDRERRDDVQNLASMIIRHEPNVICLGGFKPNTKTQLLKLMGEEVMICVREKLRREIPYMLIDDESSRIYMNSKVGLKEFPDKDYPMLVRYCVSLGRFMQEPTLEYAALVNTENDVRNARLDPLQNLLSDEIFAKSVERAFINVVNEMGVDINAAAAFPHLSHTLQFVSGLGPRKAQIIISKVIRSGGKLESRADLIQKSLVGATIFVNCGSFIRIRNFHFQSTYHDFNLDVLDDTRVHPEDYLLARKMAADALDYEDAGVDDDESPSAHVQELMQGDVDRLNLLLLDDYAIELEKQMHAPKRVCLNVIKEELMNPYKEMRRYFVTPAPESIFTILTGENNETLREGSIISVVVTRVKDRMMIVQLGSGVEGVIHASNVDMPYAVDNLIGLFQENQALLASVIKINYDRISIDLSVRQSDVDPNQSRVQLDQFFDFDSQRQHTNEKKAIKRTKAAAPVRSVQHPFWHSINYKEAEKYLALRPRGEIVVRPSGKGKDHISITWKVDDNIYQHIDIKEAQKPNEWTLGKELIIDDIKFSEIDQIIAEFIEPMTRKITLLIDHPKYQRKSADEMFTHVSEQVSILKRSSYGFIISSDKPGSFILVFRHPTNNPHKELISVSPAGFEFRKKKFTTVVDLLEYFKQDEARKAAANIKQNRNPERKRTTVGGSRAAADRNERGRRDYQSSDPRRAGRA